MLAAMPRHLLSSVALALGAALLPAQFTGFWEPRPDLNTARQEVGAAAVGGRLYSAGGLSGFAALRTVERFDPGSGQWTSAADMPTVRHHFGMAELGGKLYAVGGYASNAFVPDDDVWEYDPQTDLWTPKAPLPIARGALVAVALAGRIWAIGGVRPGSVVVGDLTAFDPATNQWQTLAPMPTPREHLAAAAFDGKLYAAGGRRDGALFGQLEVYDPSLNQWRTLAPMPTPRAGNGAAVLEGKLLVFGGEGPRMFPETEEYDPSTNTWRRLRDMSTALHGIYPVTFGEEIVIAGGANVVGFGAVRTVLAFRYLPSGVSRYGTATPACNGAIRASVSSRALAGDSQFRVVGSPNAPPNASGALLLGGTPDTRGQLLLGASIHVHPLPPFFAPPTTADAQGAGSFGLPLPAGLQGTFYAQFVWVNTAACGGAGALSASDALSITVQ
jgi:N-acetylneuraminic acid mutarotase